MDTMENNTMYNTMQNDSPTVNYDIEIDYNKTISRFFIFRPLWGIIVFVIILIWAFPLGFIKPIHFLYKLILGRRQEWMWIRQQRFFDYWISWHLYILSLTDNRPNIIPTI